MRWRQSYTALAVMLSITTFAGCSGGNGGGGAASPAAKTTGVITSIRGGGGAPGLKAAATGSSVITVNGIDFKAKSGVDTTTAVTFGFDDTRHAESELRQGMIVTVSGVVSGATATRTGEYEAIEFQPEIRGPLGSVLSGGATYTITIMGRDVVVDGQTKIDDNGVAATIADLQGLLAGSKHPEIEVSAQPDGSGVLHATLISIKSDDFTGGMVEIEGVISSVAASDRFTVGGVEVLVSSGTGTAAATRFKEMTAADIRTGLPVEVKGILTGATLAATVIEKEDGFGSGVEVNDEVSIKGTAMGALSNNSFTLNGPNGPVTVRVDGSTRFKGGASDQSIVATNAMLEVEGAMRADQDGGHYIQAAEVSLETETGGEEDSGSGESHNESSS